ncbi:MAG: oligosaccharide flippase family protein [Myxococcota bacterium]
MRDAESKVQRGFFWLGASGGALRLIDLASSIVILWRLSAEQMGLASLAWTVAVIIESFNGLGIGVAMVQAEQLEEDELDSLFWFSVAVGVGLSFAIALASPSIASAFGRGAYWPMLAVASTRLAFMAVALVPMQLLQRRLEFKALAVVQTLAAALAGITKVALLLAGSGAWALVLSHAAEGLFTLGVVYLLAPFWPKARFSLQKTLRFVRFGAKAAASTVLYQSYRNLDFVIVGRAFGVATLGAYRIAFDVAMVPAMAILDVVNRTAFPIYSRIGTSHLDSLKRMFLSMTKRLALVTGPLALLSALFAPDILALVSGARWSEAGPMIQVLCWAAFLRTLTQSIPQLFHAAGRPELAAYDSLITLPCFFACGWGLVRLFGASLGANAVSFAWIATYSLTLVVLFFMARSIFPLRGREFAKSLLPAFALMALLALVLVPLAPVAKRFLPAPVATLAGVALGLCLAFGYARYVLKIRLAPKAVSTRSEIKIDAGGE